MRYSLLFLLARVIDRREEKKKETRGTNNRQTSRSRAEGEAPFIMPFLIDLQERRWRMSHQKETKMSLKNNNKIKERKTINKSKEKRAQWHYNKRGKRPDRKITSGPVIVVLVVANHTR